MRFSSQADWADGRWVCAFFKTSDAEAPQGARCAAARRLSSVGPRLGGRLSPFAPCALAKMPAWASGALMVSPRARRFRCGLCCLCEPRSGGHRSERPWRRPICGAGCDANPFRQSRSLCGAFVLDSCRHGDGESQCRKDFRLASDVDAREQLTKGQLVSRSGTISARHRELCHGLLGRRNLLLILFSISRYHHVAYVPCLF